MTFERLQKQVFAALRDPTGYNDATKVEYVKEWLNKAEQKICSITDYYITTSSSITTTADTREYQLPDGTKEVIAVVYDDDNKLYPIDITKTVDDPSSTGTPGYYYIRANYIGLYPTPDDAKTLTIYYSSIGGNMSKNEDTPIIPEEWQMALVYYAALHYAVHLDDTRVAVFSQLWQNEIAQIIADSVNKENSSRFPEVGNYIETPHYRSEY